MKNDRPPRISHISKQYDAQNERLMQVLTSPHKLQKDSVDQLWDIYRKLLAIQSEIKQHLGTPPADILEMQDTPVTISGHEYNILLRTAESSLQTASMQSSCSEEITERIVERRIHRNNTASVEQTTMHTSATEVEISEVEYQKGFKKEYIRLLERMRKHRYNSTMVVTLVDLIYRWFTTRFKPRSACPDGFKNYTYGINQISQGIYAIVLSYADHVTHGTQDGYVADFNAWLNKLYIDSEVTNKHTLPLSTKDYMYPNDNTPVHTQTLILWNAIIAPFRKDIRNIFNTYKEGLDIDFMDDLVLGTDHSDMIDSADCLSPDGNIPDGIMARYSLD